jgi:hypothetical protein
MFVFQVSEAIVMTTSRHLFRELCDILLSSNSTAAQYVTLKLKFDEEKLKHGNLTQQNDFGPIFLHSFPDPGKRHSKAEHVSQV